MAFTPDELANPSLEKLFVAASAAVRTWGFTLRVSPLFVLKGKEKESR